MADEDVENIGGISVSIGASHSRLVSDLAEADRIIESWAQRKVNISIGAAFAGAQGQAPARAPTAAPLSFGAGSATRAQAQQGQTALQRAINAELAKTGETYNQVTGEIESTTKAVRSQKAVIVETQQVAAQPTALNIDTGS